MLKIVLINLAQFQNTLIQIHLKCLLTLKSDCPASINHPGYNRRTIKRLQKNIKIVGDCWIWTGDHNWKGYGAISYKKKTRGAHQISYMLIGKKTITPNLVLDHLCRNRNCINPNHLEEVTNQENLHRGKGFGWIHRKVSKIKDAQ